MRSEKDLSRVVKCSRPSSVSRNSEWEISSREETTTGNIPLKWNICLCKKKLDAFKLICHKILGGQSVFSFK